MEKKKVITVAMLSARIMYEISMRNEYENFIMRNREEKDSFIDREAALFASIAIISREVNNILKDWGDSWIEITEKIAELILEKEDIYMINTDIIIKKVKTLI